MERILEWLNNPLVWLGSCILFGIIFKKIAVQWRQLTYLLLAVIEVFDTKIHDILTPELEAKLGRIKRIVARTLTSRQKKDVDNLLGKMKVKGNQGYLHTDKLTVEDAEVEEVKNLCKVKSKNLI